MSKASEKPDPAWEARVQEMLAVEKKYNHEWSEAHIYESDAPPEGSTQEHYMVTFPYPYMNGRLHLGHLFTVTKAEYAARYQRMKGKCVLFPFGFHCTGMPIKASADKLALELKTGKAVVSSNQHLHSKAASKAGTAKSQFEILQQSDIPDEEIPEFANTDKWLRYFPPLGQQDLELFGAAIDWRRSFITTEVNPYYDHFIRWQFNILYRKKYVEFGKRPTVYSMKDQQPCMDHDRSSGEGVQPQEYTLIKLALQDVGSVSAELASFNKPVYLLAATLRPETMIGQTNFWVKPDAKYVAAYSKDGSEIWVAAKRSIRNLFAQELIQSMEPLCLVEANSLIGANTVNSTAKQLVNKAGSPFASDGKPFDLGGVATPEDGELTERPRLLPGFPLTTILMAKGTGIVTSVPSDAPADFECLERVKADDKLLAKAGVEARDLYSIPIIKCKLDFSVAGTNPEMSPAEYFLVAVGFDKNAKEKVREEKLELAKEKCYSAGFYNGTMIFGPYKDEKVAIAKEKMKAAMCEQHTAISYYEPESEVISRSGDECVVVFCDQWYLKYGEENWKKAVVDHFNAKVNTFHPEIREKFLKCFDWLGPWACSRQFGLGTHMPFDEQYLVDSLSDSTIYTAYYTIAHLLQSDLFGAKEGLCHIPPEKVNDAFFDCVFLNGPAPADIDPAIIARFQREFNYWYPVNCRVSGKDLVTNHLTMYLYNHAAIFPEDKWPIGIRANGHLKLNNKKMSKSEGNFLTAYQAIEKYSSTAVRIALADGGDNSDDSNFVESIARSVLKTLYTVIDISKLPTDDMRQTVEGYYDELLSSRISKSIKESDAAYEKMCFKAALKACFYDMLNAWNDYTQSIQTDKLPISAPLHKRFVEAFLLMLTPIAPHYTDMVWREILGKTTHIVTELYPTPEAYNPQIFFMDRFLKKACDQIKFKIKKTKADRAALFIKTEYTPSQLEILKVLQKNFNTEENTMDAAAIAADIRTNEVLSKIQPKEYMPFYKFMQEAVIEYGDFLLSPTPLVDQEDLIKTNMARLLRQLPGITAIDIVKKEGDSDLFEKKAFDEAQVYVATATVHAIATPPPAKKAK